MPLARPPRPMLQPKSNPNPHPVYRPLSKKSKVKISTLNVIRSQSDVIAGSTAGREDAELPHAQSDPPVISAPPQPPTVHAPSSKVQRTAVLAWRGFQQVSKLAEAALDGLPGKGAVGVLNQLFRTANVRSVLGKGNGAHAGLCRPSLKTTSR